jgi:hypothetical protein
MGGRVCVCSTPRRSSSCPRRPVVWACASVISRSILTRWVRPVGPSRTTRPHACEFVSNATTAVCLFHRWVRVRRAALRANRTLLVSTAAGLISHDVVLPVAAHWPSHRPTKEFFARGRPPHAACCMPIPSEERVQHYVPCNLTLARNLQQERGNNSSWHARRFQGRRPG